MPKAPKKPPAPGVAELLADFLSHLAASDHSKSCMNSYDGNISRFADWIIEKYGSFNPAAVSPLDAIEYRGYLQGKKGRKNGKAKPGTVNHALVSLRVFFAWLGKNGAVRSNSLEGIKPVATARAPAPKWLSRNEQTALVHAVQDGGRLRDMAMVAIMLHAGLRVSEVCSLGRNDIEISDRKGVVQVFHGKGNKFREIPLNNTVRKILARWMSQNASGVLFPNRYGGPISVSGVEKLMAKYAYRAKLEASPHSLRHAFCKNLIDMGVPIDQVAMLAGHSSLDVTRRYTTPSMADLQAAVDKTAWE